MPVLNCMALRLPPSVSLTIQCNKTDQTQRKDSLGTESTNTDNTPIPLNANEIPNVNFALQAAAIPQTQNSIEDDLFRNPVQRLIGRPQNAKLPNPYANQEAQVKYPNHSTHQNFDDWLEMESEVSHSEVTVVQDSIFYNQNFV